MTDVSMQRILLDTNVLLDYLLHRDDHAKMAEAVMELGAKNNITLLCASLSLKDIAYLSSSAIRREFKPNESEVENFTFSLQKRHRDFEDDLIIVAAQQSGANCVVTSDAELISHFPEYCKTPAEIVAALA
ncbi:MAG: PIN domain-containing protein [Bifidobacterium longum]|nr:PIN domain-containing protein [Bifidobacterium longum]